MTQVKWREFRDNLADIINRVRFHNERIAITRHGKVVAQLVPSEHIKFTDAAPHEAEIGDLANPGIRKRTVQRVVQLAK